MTLRLLSLVISALLIQACSFKKDDSEASPAVPANNDVIETIQKEQEKQAFEGKLTEQNVFVKFEPQSHPLQYKMIITWPKQIKRIQLDINDDAPVIISLADNQNYYEKLVKSEEVQKINLIAFDSISGGPISSLLLTKTPPLDYLFDRPKNLIQNTTMNAERVFFKDGHTLYTNGYALTINAQQLIVLSDESYQNNSILSSHILTRHPSVKIKKDEDNFDLPIIIKVKSAIGLLKVGLVGADGNDGRNGVDIERLLNIQRIDPSKNGKPGSAGEIQTLRQPCKKMGPDITGCEPITTICKKQPQDGEPGEQGSKGEDGENGQDGGPTGSISVFIEDHLNFKLQVFQRRGLPGVGGLGASGHPGGKGGEPGASQYPCRTASKGLDGLPGENGKNGIGGKPGNLGTITGNVIIQVISE